MQDSEFDRAFTRLLGHEGAYSNHKKDSGGETMWGITVAVARAEGYVGAMKDLPVEIAKQIYKRNYWDAVKAKEVPQKLRYALFDAAVNSGTTKAVKWLQQAINVLPDGVIGEVTIKEAKLRINIDEVLTKMLANRLEFLTSLTVWPTFGKGWTRRVASIMKEPV